MSDHVIPTLIADWSYETDLTLAHKSGLKVFFPRRKPGLTPARCLGYHVNDDMVFESHRSTLVRGDSEPKSPQQILDLIAEAEALFHNFPAGSPGAPRSIKRDLLLRLAEKRQTALWEGYGQIGEFHNGAYESSHVSPITKSAGTVDAKIFIFLRDWASEPDLLAPLDRDARDLGYIQREQATQKNLAILLQRHFNCDLSEAYATTLFPFIRRGDIPYLDLERAAFEFGIPQLKIIAPKLVICLGLETFNVLRRIQRLDRVRDLAEGINQSFRFHNADVCVQAHTGFYGKMKRRSGIDEDWRSMSALFKRSAKSSSISASDQS